MEGCLIGELNGICYKCKESYILNNAGICDNANISNC